MISGDKDLKKLNDCLSTIENLSKILPDMVNKNEKENIDQIYNSISGLTQKAQESLKLVEIKIKKNKERSDRTMNDLNNMWNVKK